MNKLRWLAFCVALMIFVGCGSDGGDIESTPDGQGESKEPAPEARPEATAVLTPVESADRALADIMLDFGLPVSALPVISPDNTAMRDQKVFAPEGATEPFTGRLRETYPDGRPSFEATYLGGVLHGPQLRWHPSGHLALQALFSEGNLVGVKSRWYPDGTKREEEIWSEGRFRGRRQWDEDGLLVREELVNN